MKRKPELTAEEVAGSEPIASTYYDVKTLAKFMNRVVAAGFLPARVLKEEFSGEEYSMCIAVLYRQFRVLIEVTRSWEDGEAIGYELADERHSRSFAKQMPKDLQFLMQFQKGKANRYTDFVFITAHCKWTNFALGAVPGKSTKDEEVNVFERYCDEGIIIPAYCLRSMAAKTLPMIGKEAVISQHIRFVTVRIAKPKLLELKHAVVRGNQGLGLKRSEAIEVGTEFDIHASIPTSAISQADYIKMLKLGGVFVRLSPARSAGYGDFEVLSVENMAV